MPRTVFLHGRPSHPFHQALARSLGADFLVKDFLLRWHDHDAPRLRRYLSWLLCSFCFPQREAYDLILTEGPQFVPLLMRRLGLLRPHQRTAAIIAGETPYFLKANRYPPASAAALRAALASYDLLVCVGAMHAELVREVLGERTPPLLTISSGLSPSRRQALSTVEPDPGSRLALHIGNMIAPWRAFYKGLDLAVASVARARRWVPGLHLEIVGTLSAEVIQQAQPAGVAASSWLSFVGPVADLRPSLRRAGLYIHLGRGEAGPMTVLEAMSAGVPALVSEWTGLREAVAAVDPHLVVPLDEDMAAERIAWFMALSPTQRQELSRRSRQVAARYTEERAVSSFRDGLAGFMG
ncbi:MAG: glycosyltransferase family 4 protein [Myxococcales bacterium]|nr:glycosyltransferase family 4 protein [Myxococcota bacterium]MDW8280579.1 glycosyltransferase family 4 protein [Myxococcales bacterium]